MPYRPSPRQLEYFLAVAETGHFGKAAERCSVSQPTLSAQLKLLEESMGVTLIDRGGGLVGPTPAGEALLGLARQALEVLDELVSQAGAQVSPFGGLIRLGVAPTFGPYFMPYLLKLLFRELPGVEIYIRDERPDILRSMLLEGALDCIVTPSRLDQDRLETEIFCREQVLLGISSASTMAAKQVLELSDLQGQRLLTMGPGYRLYEEVRALAEATGSPPREDYLGTSLDTLRQMVSIGMGISLFPAGYIHFEFSREANVVLRQIAGFPMERELSVAWRRGSVRSRYFSQLVSYARKAVREMAVPGLEVVDP